MLSGTSGDGDRSSRTETVEAPGTCNSRVRRRAMGIPRMSEASSASYAASSLSKNVCASNYPNVDCVAGEHTLFLVSFDLADLRLGGFNSPVGGNKKEGCAPELFDFHIFMTHLSTVSPPRQSPSRFQP